MKKQLLLSIALVAVCGIVAIGCKGEEEPAANKPAAELTPQGAKTTPTTGGNAAGSGSLSTPGAPPTGPNGSPP